MRIGVPRTSIPNVLHKVVVWVINTPLVVYQPTLCALWIRLRDLKLPPTDEHIWTGVITCGVGLSEVKECRVGGEASTLPFTDCPFGGTSLELEAREAGDSPAFSSKEEVAIFSFGCERGSSSSKRRGEVDGGGDSELEAGAGGEFVASHQFTSSSHPFSGMVPGTRTKRSALMMRHASRRNPFCKEIKITSISSKLP